MGNELALPGNGLAFNAAPQICPKEMQEIMRLLRMPLPFEAHSVRVMQITRDEKRASMALYADPRAYAERLDEVYPLWQVAFQPWGDRLIAYVNIGGYIRASTGEMDKQSEKSEIGGTSAEAQAFKRACAQWGLGRYLYKVPMKWWDYDKENKRFTHDAEIQMRDYIIQLLKDLGGAELPAPRKATSPARKTTPAAKPEPAVEPAPASRAPGRGFAFTKDMFDSFNAAGERLAGEKWSALRGEAAKALNLEQWSDMTAEQWDALCNWIEKMENRGRIYRFNPEKVAV